VKRTKEGERCGEKTPRGKGKGEGMGGGWDPEFRLAGDRRAPYPIYINSTGKAKGEGMGGGWAPRIQTSGRPEGSLPYLYQKKVVQTHLTQGSVDFRSFVNIFAIFAVFFMFWQASSSSKSIKSCTESIFETHEL